MNEKEIRNLGEKIVKKVMKRWYRTEKVGKEDFEQALDLIIDNISKNINMPAEAVARHTDAVIEDFAEDYQKLPDEMKGYEAVVLTVYMTYMKKLGML
jgi:hypothetical protein